MYSKPSSDIRLSVDSLSVPPAIHPKLASVGFRFIKLRPRSKLPYGTKWQIDNNYSADDQPIQFWLKHYHSFEIGERHYEGYGNYGVLCSATNIVIDIDSTEVLQLFLDSQQKGFEGDSLPPTLTIRSGSGRGLHLVYRTENAHTIAFVDPSTGQNVGHVKSTGGYAVGPSSIHDKSLQPYVVVTERDIAFVDFEKILSFFAKYIVKKEPSVIIEQNSRLERAKYEKFSIDIPIASIAMPEKPVDRGNGEIQGAHPIHGSSGGMNFSINTRKNTWHCFRDSSGGGPLELLAVKHDIIRCDEAHKGCLRGDKFIEVLKLARNLGYDISLPTRKAVEKPRILTNEPILLETLPDDIPDAHITLIDAFPRLGKTHWAVIQAIKHRTANIISNTHSINEQQIRIFREHRNIGQFAVHLEGKRRSCRNSKKPCQCKQCDKYPFKEEGDYMRFDAIARDVLYEKEILTNHDVPEGMCPYWVIKSAEKVAHFCFTVSSNLSVIEERLLTIIDEDPTISHFYPSSVDLAENSMSAHASQAKCNLGEKWEGVVKWKKYLTDGDKRPEGKKTILRIIEVLEQIHDVLLLNRDENESYNKTKVLQELNKIDTFIPEPEDISKIDLIEKIKKFEVSDTLSTFAEPLLFPYVKKQFMWQGHHPAILRMIANEEQRIRDPPAGKMIIIGSTRAEMFAKSTGKETAVIRVKTFPFSENFLFIVVKPGENESYAKNLEQILKDASKTNEVFRYPSLILVGTEKQQGRLVKILGGIAKGSRDENRIGQQWNRKSGQMNIFYQNSVISRGIDVEFYTRLFVHTTSFANPYWMAVADVAEHEEDAELATKAYGILDAIMMDETTNSVLRISPVRRNPQTVTHIEQFEDKIPKVVVINEEELWKVKPGVLESVNMVTTTFDILRDNLVEMLDQTGSLPLKGDDLITIDLPGVKPEMGAKEKAQAIVSLLKTAPFDTRWKSDYTTEFLNSVENTIINRIEQRGGTNRKAYAESLIRDLSKKNKSHTSELLQRVMVDMIRRGKLRERRSGKLSWVEVRPLACGQDDPFKEFWEFEAASGETFEDILK